MKTDSIFIIDDDEDDCQIMKEVFESLALSNKIYFFNTSDQALQFLQDYNEKIFFILCDINMPKIDGFMLRKKVNEMEHLRIKAIPFLFYSTSGDGHIVQQAYSLNIQGYFKKPAILSEYKAILLSIIDYWSKSELP